MFTLEEKTKALKLLIKYDGAYTQVIRELGYPSMSSLMRWYTQHKETNTIAIKTARKPRYSKEEQDNAINYFLEHGKNISRTCMALGYPSRPTLTKWIEELEPEKRKHCYTSSPLIKYSQADKRQAVISLVSKEKNSKEISIEYGVTQGCIHSWKRQLMKEGLPIPMDENKNKANHTKDLKIQNKELQAEVAKLQEQVYRLQLEHDVLEKAVEVIKKEKGVSLQTLTNREKAIVINALREKHQLKDLLIVLNMAKSTYCYQVQALKIDKYADLRKKVKKLFNQSEKRYGYRRIHSKITADGTIVSEKVIRKIMAQEKLVSVAPNRRKYSSYKGEIGPVTDNLIQRNFQAEKPNQKWLTDITEFHIPAGKIYLSPIIDCFDGLPVSWSMSTSPNADLVNSMLDEAITTLSEDEHPILHSDRGVHYQWPGWIERIENAGLTRSMSRKGYAPDNAACEGFFGIIKTEFFYCRSWKGISIEQFINELNEYLSWYAEDRIKMSLGGLSPLEYRRSLGLAS